MSEDLVTMSLDGMRAVRVSGGAHLAALQGLTARGHTDPAAGAWKIANEAVKSRK